MDPASNIKLVKAIEKHPCLYNYKLPEYARHDITENAWNRVAQEVHGSVPRCKEKWKNLRTVFVRKLKGTAIGSSTKLKKQYYLNNIMHFLLPFVKCTTTKINEYDNIPLSSLHDLTKHEIITDNVYDADDPIEGQQLETLHEAQESRHLKLASAESQNEKHDIGASEVNKSFIEFAKFYKNNLENDPRKMFLLSMLPEINELTETQMRKFRRKVLKLIDDISSDIQST